MEQRNIIEINRNRFFLMGGSGRFTLSKLIEIDRSIFKEEVEEVSVSKLVEIN